VTYIEQYFTNELRRALSRALVPPTKVFRRLPVNKTIFLNHASLQRRSANTYTWDFPDVTKFRVAALIRYRRKQCGSGIRTIIRIRLKSYSVRPCPDICRHATFHPNPCIRFWVILLTDMGVDSQKSRGTGSRPEWVPFPFLPFLSPPLLFLPFPYPSLPLPPPLTLEVGPVKSR